MKLKYDIKVVICYKSNLINLTGKLRDPNRTRDNVTHDALMSVARIIVMTDGACK